MIRSFDPAVDQGKQILELKSILVGEQELLRAVPTDVSFDVAAQTPWYYMVEDESDGRKGGPGSGHWGHAGRPGTRGGSTPAGILLGAYKKARKSIRLAMQETQSHGFKTGKEALVGLRYGGEKVNGTAIGTVDSVSPSEEIMRSSKIIVHNHPGSSSLGPEDIATIFSDEWGNDHIIAVGHDGTMYRASRTPRTKTADEIAGMTMMMNAPNLPTAILRLWKAEINERMHIYEPKVQSGEMSSDEAWRKHTHEAMIDLAETLGLDYQRTEP